MCYYNYRCAQRFGSIIDFNHVWSNASYIIFGILFILICKFSKGPNAKTGYGIPSHYGVFYALGFALAMEGVLSAAYHLCPNQSTFQFGKNEASLKIFYTRLKIRNYQLNIMAHRYVFHECHSRSNSGENTPVPASSSLWPVSYTKLKLTFMKLAKKCKP